MVVQKKNYLLLHISNFYLRPFKWFLTDGIFETGAYRVPTKPQKPTILGQGGPSTQQMFARIYRDFAGKSECGDLKGMFCDTGIPRTFYGGKICSVVPNVQILAGHAIGTIRLAPTTTLHFNTVLKGIHSCIGFFSFFDKISLEI